MLFKIFVNHEPPKKKKLDYSRVSGSPYPAGSAEDKKLATDQAAYSANNRAKLGQGIKDVATGRAAVEGAKVIGRAVTGGISGAEKQHKQVTDSGSKPKSQGLGEGVKTYLSNMFGKKKKSMPTSDGYMMMNK